ncbi:MULTISPECIES: dienelactone hydrolase [unclassified Novosphingobium]|uniref:alpha/beta hydrolase family protein n=1 Tax=unclassified Novosphingobium TaxID=2644732 RepID=UPI00146ADC4A|nr:MULTISPECIES: dienelactone hydrolase [unclassified Novosphingobium]NMN06430.1 putative dienelactone hydrolase [Novosphingobium sp. SG919]NMN89123.1 putative dienelactone hydrolase [Novosphingobium sp. SG916]
MKPLFAAAAVAIGATAFSPAQAFAAPAICNATWTDAARSGRPVPVRIRMPEGRAQVPVILFSHGLGGSLDAGTNWVTVWAAAGFATVNIEHAGSDAAIWKGRMRPMQGRRSAMNGQQLQARVDDVHFVLDRLAKGGREGACDLGRLDMDRVGMAGHSFGAQTVLAVSGARYGGAAIMHDPRIKAAIALSPQPALRQDDRSAFGGIAIPFFSITGTRDELPFLNSVAPQDRTRPFAAMPTGSKYLLVLEDANHMMLGGQSKRMPVMRATAHIVDAVARFTTDFWRTYLMSGSSRPDLIAKDRHLLAKEDHFEEK